MKSILKTWSVKKHFIFSLLIIIIINLINIIPFGSEASSIGIIGGADGPTAIYISSKIGTFMLRNMTTFLIFVLLLFSYKPIKNKIEK